MNDNDKLAAQRQERPVVSYFASLLAVCYFTTHRVIHSTEQ